MKIVQVNDTLLKKVCEWRCKYTIWIQASTPERPRKYECLGEKARGYHPSSDYIYRLTQFDFSTIIMEITHEDRSD